MSKKHEAHHDGHHKKKMTKKEIKAMNHAKLMASKQPSNVVDINALRDQNKKAA